MPDWSRGKTRSLVHMPSFNRPSTPKFLATATYRMFGEACLRCETDRPLEVAHILDWPTCVARAGQSRSGTTPPRDWHYDVAVDNFHNLGNVLPLCKNCHGLYDGPRYTDVTECELRRYRDAAVRRPEVLARLIDFIGIELSGRPGRCTHRIDGKRQHSHMVDTRAVMTPLRWIADGYESGVLTDEPHMIVSNSGGWHFHVHLDHATVAHCAGSHDDYAAPSRLCD
jgi:hypothetical protein